MGVDDKATLGRGFPFSDDKAELQGEGLAGHSSNRKTGRPWAEFVSEDN